MYFSVNTSYKINMIEINNKKIELDRFPDGTLHLKNLDKFTDISLISWFYESDNELMALIAICKYVKEHYINNTVNLFLPYIPNARQDRVESKADVFTLKYFTEIINWLDFNNVFVLDPHSSVSKALINNIIVVDIHEDIVKTIIKKLSYNNEITLFYPDEGSCKRYSKNIDYPYCFGVKRRNWETGDIMGLEVIGDTSLIKEKNILIVDDICSYGGTFYHAAKKLKNLGAKDIYLYVTHCENTILKGDLLNSGLIRKVYTTDSIFTESHEMIEVIGSKNKLNNKGDQL